MTPEIKKLIATAIATGGIVSGGFVASERLNCPYTVRYMDKDVCISQEVKDAIEGNLRPSQGFGGTRFGGN
jgi:hypothetical protein